MRKIIFYRLKNGKCPIEDYLNLLSQKQIEKVFFDGSELVVLNHAFTKKTQKTPQKEIKKAEKRKKDYFFYKGDQHERPAKI